MKYIDEQLFWREFFLVTLVLLLLFTKSVLADEIVSKVDFHTYVASGGDYRTIMDDDFKMEVDYLKVNVKAKKGDKYDVRFKYSKDWLQTTKTLAVKKELIGKKNKEYTIYFIPKKGKCPGEKNQCVRVPVVKGISTETKLIDSIETIYGIEIYNGSAFGWLMEVKGNYCFVRYEDEKID